MKMVIAVVSDDDGVALMDALNNEGFGATKLCSTGGFLKAGNTTVLVGTEDEKVDKVLEIIKKSVITSYSIHYTKLYETGIS